MYTLSTPLSTVTYIPKNLLPKLKNLGIETVGDLFFHFPSRYEDLSKISKIDEISEGSAYTIEGTISSIKTARTWHKKMTITEALLEDETGTVRIVWFNQPYIETSISQGKEIRISGKVTVDSKGFIFQSPVWEMRNRRPTHTGRIVPVYPETKGLTSRWLRWKIQEIITKKKIKIEDSISKEILERINLPDLITALRYIHFPKSEQEYLLAQKRFAFEEMLLLQLRTLTVKKLYENQKAASIKFDEKLIKDFVTSLPFELTNAQRKSAWQILKDLEKPQPMNRLLNGDVGSGKTIVAAIAALQTVSAGYQIAILAPTEVLARQHFEGFCKLFDKYEINIGLLTNSYKIVNRKSSIENKSVFKENFKNKGDFIQEIKLSNIEILIGTHAIIQEDVKFKNLAVVVIDEQHRFGVAQRAYLQQKSSEINDGLEGKIPHLLSMTATPIPRTLTLSFFGNLDISILDEIPKNRKPIITKILPDHEGQDLFQPAKNRRNYFPGS